MNRMVCTVTAAAALSVAFSANAKTIEEILKEKGLITQEEYDQASAKNDLVYYEPGKGITIETKDGNYKAQLGGRIQTLYTYTDFDNSAKADTGATSIRRMLLNAQGYVFSKKLQFGFEQDFGKAGTKTNDAWMSYQFAEPLTVKIGQFKYAQGRQQLTSSGKQLFVDRSVGSTTFNAEYDMGAELSGRFGGYLVEYRAGVFNGNGPNKANQKNDYLYAARVDVNPLGRFDMDEVSFSEAKPLLNIGASVGGEKFTDADVAGAYGSVGALGLSNIKDAATFDARYGDSLTMLVAATNVNFKYRELSLAGEYYWMNAEPYKGDSLNAHGYFVQGGYMILPKTFEAAIRYSAIKSDDKANFPQAHFDRKEFQVGLNYYLYKHIAKLQADYTKVKDEVANKADDNIFRLQAQIGF